MVQKSTILFFSVGFHSFQLWSWISFWRMWGKCTAAAINPVYAQKGLWPQGGSSGPSDCFLYCLHLSFKVLYDVILFWYFQYLRFCGYYLLKNKMLCFGPLSSTINHIYYTDLSNSHSYSIVLSVHFVSFFMFSPHFPFFFLSFHQEWYLSNDGIWAALSTSGSEGDY